MTTLATMVVKLVGDITNFVTSQDEAAKHARATQKLIKDATNISKTGFSELTAVVKDSVEYTVRYAGQVRSLSRDIGASAEQASMLIQAADDVNISFESLQTGMRAAIRKGFDPSIEGLGQLADKYLSIQNPIARTKFLMDTFGKSGADMAALMQLGSQGIAAAGAEAKSFGLVLSETDVKAARQLEINLDNLEDRFNGLKVTIGNKVIPMLNQAAENFDILINGQQRLQDAFVATQDKMIVSVLRGEMPLDKYNEALAYVAVNAGVAKDATQIYTQDLLDSRTATEKTALGLTLIGDRYYRLTDQVHLLTQAELDNNASSWAAFRGLILNSPLLKDLATKYNQVTSQVSGYDNMLKRSKKSIEEHTTAMGRENAVMGEVTSRAIQYADSRRKLEELGRKLAAVDAEIAAAGPAHLSLLQNKKLTTNELAAAQAKLAAITEDLTKAAKKKGETDAEYNARISALRVQYDNLNASLQSHTAFLGGATKAQRDNRQAILDEITALQLQSNQARATEGFNTLNQALSSGVLSAEQYHERLVALNLVTGMFSGTDLAAAEKQQLLLNALKDPGATNWYNQIVANAGALNTQYIPATQAAIQKNSEFVHKSKQDIMDEMGNVAAQTMQGVSGSVDTGMRSISSAVGAAHGLVKTLGDSIRNLPDKKTIDIYINVHGSAPDVGGGGRSSGVGGDASKAMAGTSSNYARAGGPTSSDWWRSLVAGIRPNPTAVAAPFNFGPGSIVIQPSAGADPAAIARAVLDEAGRLADARIRTRA